MLQAQAPSVSIVPTLSCLLLVLSQHGGRNWFLGTSVSLQHLPSSSLSAATFSQRWLCAGALRVSLNSGQFITRVLRTLGSLEEVWKTNKPISHLPFLVATSKQPLLGPTWTVEGLCLSLLAPPSLLDFGSLKSQGTHPGQASPVLLD